MFEKKKITSFDQNYCSEISIKNSEKYRELEDDHALVDNLITIGSGLSYTAAGFKKDSLSINIESFKNLTKIAFMSYSASFTNSLSSSV